MNWSQWVILGLCFLNLILLVSLATRPAPGIVNTTATNAAKPTDGRIPLTDPDPYGAPPKAEDKSVILLTPERDAKILEAEDE